MTATCGRDDCSSSCHDPELTTGRYCAPARCYCAGCPAYVALPATAGPMTPEQMEARRLQLVGDARRQLAVAHFRHDVSERVADSYVGAAAGGLVAA
jgi:hypothetical protein